MQQILLHIFTSFALILPNGASWATNQGQSSNELVNNRLWPNAVFQNFSLTHAVDWRIRRGIASVCPRTRTGSGALLESLTSYPASERELVESATGVGFLPQVIAVAEDSPADVAGLRVGDVLLAVEGTTFELANAPDDAAKPAIAQVQAILDGQGQDRDAHLTILRDGHEATMSLSRHQICGGNSYVEISDSKDAYSDRVNVAITTGLLAFLLSEDELAFVLSHELAHTIYLDSDRNGLSRKRKERRADLFAAFAMRCSGYDVGAAPTFLRRLGNTDWLGSLITLSHPSFGKRAKAISEFADELSCDSSEALEAITQKARS